MIQRSENSNNNLSLESHSKSRRFDSRPMPYTFDKSALGQIEFLRDEIKINNNIIERLLTLKPVLHDNQPCSYNSQEIKIISKNIVNKNIDFY